MHTDVPGRRLSAGRGVLACAGLSLVALTSTARADEDREAQLEDRIEQLERKLAELEARPVGEGQSELEARVEDLEKLTRKDGSGLFPYWSSGIRMDSADKRFKIKFGGRIMNDWTFWNSNSALETATGEEQNTEVEFRRARLYFEGQIHDNVAFKAQYDFAGATAFKDMWIAFKKLLPFGATLKVGHFKEPASIDELTSSKYIAFMERALPNVFAPGRNNGVQASGQVGEAPVIWAVGVFRDSNDLGDDENNSGAGEYNVTARLAGTPFVSDDGKNLVHLGAWYSRRDLSSNMVRYRQRPEIHTSARFVDTGTFEADEADVMGLEAAGIFGPVHLQGEWIQNRLSARKTPSTATSYPASYGNPTFDGWYGQAGVYLTPGDHRRYKASSGAMDRTKPRSDYGDEGGVGAVEVLVRYSELDLSDKHIDGGSMKDVTVGLNWYLNPNTRVMINWVRSNPDIAGVGNVEAVMLRFQIDF